MLRSAKSFKHSLIAIIALVAMGCMSLSVATIKAQAQQAPAQTQKTPSRNYVEVVFSKKTNNAKAVDLVQRALRKDLDEMQTYVRKDPEIYARYISLGPNLPKNSVIAQISHPAVCGSSGCRTVILTPSADGKRLITVFDTTLDRVFLNYRKGQPRYDVMAIVGPRYTDGFGVFFFNTQKGVYTFAGVSKFAKK